MRGAFVRTLTELAAGDDRIVLLTGDLGFMALEPFADRFPDRFFNVGVAEQNMIGLATGLAEAGFLPFAYSIATFASLRGYEFIRNGPVLQGLRVRVVGMGGGFEYGPAGPTHHALEDIAVMRIQTGLTVVTPADHEQAASALRASYDLGRPVYYRLGKDDGRTVPGLRGRFRLGRLERLHDGHDIAIISTGAISSEAAAATQQLRQGGVDAGLAILASFNPSPTEDLIQVLSQCRAAITVEAHYRTGGLGSLVAETIAESGLSCRLVRLGVVSPDGIIGSEDFLNCRHGIDRHAIVKLASGLLTRA